MIHTTFAFLINTYNRPESLSKLIDSIKRLNTQCHIYIIQDGGEDSYSKYKFSNNITFKKHNQNYGKQLYWRTCNELFDMARQGLHQWMFMLPDDVTVKPDFLEKAIDKWQEIADHNMIALNLIHDRHLMKCWTNFQPIDMGHSILTNWVDMCMLFDRRLFNYIGHIPPIKRDWEKRPMLGSGVGSYISRVVYAKKGKFYQVKESLVEFQDSHKTSVMNPKVETDEE